MWYNIIVYIVNNLGDDNVLDPKYLPYLTKKTQKTEHGYEYIVLRRDTPKDLFDEYMNIVMEQDERVERGERINMF